MANKKVEALKEQLEMYTAEIDKYEKEFLANDGKINEQEQNLLDSIRTMLEKVHEKLNKNKKQKIELTKEQVTNKVFSFLDKLKNMVPSNSSL